MQIKPIIAAAGALACLLLQAAAIAADAANPSGEAVILQAMAEDQADSEAGKRHMTKMEKPATTVSVRNTRPKTEHHKDARACLDLGKNEAVIKCANKYR